MTSPATSTTSTPDSPPRTRHDTHHPRANHDYDSLVDDLTYRFDGIHDRAVVADTVARARTRLEAAATIPDFLPVLVARFAREHLTATAQADGRIATTMPELLFVCVHNAGRSQMAAGYLAHLAGDRIDVRSAGSAPSNAINPVAVAAMAVEGIDITGEHRKILTTDAVKASDVVITMGCGDTCPFYPGKRYEDWVLGDPAGQGIDAVRPIRDEIRRRVETLIEQLSTHQSDA